jgi:hypothetical protein
MNLRLRGIVVPGFTEPGAIGKEKRDWLKPEQRRGLCLSRFSLHASGE